MRGKALNNDRVIQAAGVISLHTRRPGRTRSPARQPPCRRRTPAHPHPAAGAVLSSGRGRARSGKLPPRAPLGPRISWAMRAAAGGAGGSGSRKSTRAVASTTILPARSSLRPSRAAWWAAWTMVSTQISAWRAASPFSARGRIEPRAAFSSRHRLGFFCWREPMSTGYPAYAQRLPGPGLPCRCRRGWRWWVRVLIFRHISSIQSVGTFQHSASRQPEPAGAPGLQWLLRPWSAACGRASALCQRQSWW